MKKTRKILFSALTALLFATLIISAVFLYLPKKSDTVYAMRSTSYNVIEEIWQGGNKPFSGENLGKLFTALTGKKNATIKDVESLLANDTDGNGDNTTVASDYFRGLEYSGANDFSDGYNISVNFAGKKWDVVYLTMDKTEKSLVLDLWQSADNVTEISKYANRSSASDKPTANYPDHLYSTSLIRVETLNNGGYASTSGTSIPTQKYEPKTTDDVENGGNTYARFTSSEAKDSVVDYLLKPNQVGYQETEFDEDTAKAYNSNKYYFPNDAYGTPATTSGKWYNDNYNYLNSDSKRTVEETKYGAWQEDYLWLPSMTETGLKDTDNGNGLWKTDASLRSTESKNIKSTTYERAWLRSGYYNYAYSACNLTAFGGGNDGGVGTEYLVRPALHLNLTSAAEAAGKAAPSKPTDDQLKQGLDYNGKPQTFTLPDFGDVTYAPKGGSAAWWDEDSHTITATEAGDYEVELTPPEDGWDDGTSDPVIFKFTINKAKISQDWSGFSKLQEHVYHPDGTTYPLALPNIGEEGYPFSLAGKDTLSAGDITVKYIIETHKESEHESFEKTFDKENLTPYNTMPDDAWTVYSKGGKCKNGKGEKVDFDVSKPLGYCVIFKVEAGNNFEPLYGYFSVHIFTEKLTINLTSDTILADIEYGEVAHTQGSLRSKILADIPDKEGIVVLDDEGKVQEDRTTAFKSEADTEKFIFYYSDGSKTFDIADEDDGTRLDAGKTYYLYVKYVGDGEDGSENYITFDWKPGRPSFKVVPREIDLDITVTGSHKYNQTPPTDWATVTPKRTTEKTGEWYGKTADNNVTNLKLQYTFTKSDDDTKTYTALSKDMPAGTYNITVESGNDNYTIKNLNPNPPTYEVKKGEFTVDFEDAEETYSGEEISHEITSLPKGLNATYTYKGKDSTSYAGPGAPTNAGTYEVTATFTVDDTDNYEVPKDIKVTLTIDKWELDFVEVNPASGVYTGEEHTGIDVSFGDIPDVLTKGTDYKIKFNGADDLPQDVGTYTVTVELIGGTLSDNYVMRAGAEGEYEITIGGITKPTGDDIDDEYKGEDYVLALSGYDKDTMSYSIEGDGAAFNEDKGEFSAKNVGTYTLTVSLADDTNTQWEGGGKEDITFTIEISQASLSFTITPASEIYTGEELGSISINFSGLKNETLALTTDYTFAFTGAGLGENNLPLAVGSYTVTVTLKGNALKNYNLSSNTATYNVTVDGIAKPTGDNIDDTYKGEKYVLALSGYDKDTMSYSTAGDGAAFDEDTGEFSAKNVGTYTLTVSLADDKNTQWDDGTTKEITFTIKISKAKLTFTISPVSGAYTGSEHDVTVDFSKSLKGTDALSAADYEISYAVTPSKTGVLGTNNKPQGVGSYTVTVTLKNTAATKNYEMADDASAEYTITAGGIDKPTGTDINDKYKGTFYELALTGYDKDKMSYSITPSDKGAEFDPASGVFKAKNVGEYKLTVTLNGSEYIWSTGGTDGVVFNINITKVTLTVTADDQTVVYGTMPTYTVTYSGFVSGESETSLNYTATASSTYTFADGIGDDFEITVNAPALDNYTVTTVSGTLKVTPKPITLKINDGGHLHGNAPQSNFTLTDVNGGLVAGDTTAEIAGLVEFYITNEGMKVELDSSLAVGEYVLCADNGNYGNYTVTFTYGKYIVSNDSLHAPTADPNADNFVYTGDELTYMPEGFDPLTMDFEGNENVQTDAGEYTVKVYPKNRELVFETAEGPKDHLEFKFVIKPAEIVELNDNGNSFIQDEVTGGGTEPFAVTLGKKNDGKFANFDTVGGQEITIWATMPLPYEGGQKPARPEFDGLARSAAAYMDITALDLNDPDYPLNVDVKKVGKYVVYYRIVAPNHADLEGEWRVEVEKDSEVVKVVFKKAYEIPYGVTPDPEEIFDDIKAMPAQYLSITKGGEDFTQTFFDEIAQGVTLGCRRKNQFGKYSDSGEYYINFTLDSNSVYTVIYREGGNNPEDDTNFDKFKITQRELALIWDTSKLSYTFTGDAITLDGLATLDGTMADDWDDIKVRFELSDHNQVITAEGEYQVTAVLVGENAKNYRFADEARAVNTVVVTAAVEEPQEQTDDSGKGVPWWVWLIVGVGAALIVTAVVIVIVVSKKKKDDEDEEAQPVQTPPAPPVQPVQAVPQEPKIIYRDINTDVDGFYDPVEMPDEKKGK